MSSVKEWLKSCARFTLPLAAALAVATPSFAQVLNEFAKRPGSVIVFPKFLTGTQTVDGVVVPLTEIELGVVCPIGLTCAEHTPVKIRFHWVCPGFQDFNTKLICKANNFDVFASINGKVVFNPNNMTMAGDTVTNVPTPPCPMGYLIGMRSIRPMISPSYSTGWSATASFAKRHVGRDIPGDPNPGSRPTEGRRSPQHRGPRPRR